MGKLGISLGWPPPRSFELPTDVRENFSNWVGVSLTDDVARGMEQATDNLIEAYCIEAGYIDERTGKVVPTDAEFAPTRRCLKKTLRALKKFKHFLDHDHRDLDANAVAVRWLIAKQSVASGNVMMPNTEKLRFDVESWEILGYRVLRGLEQKHRLEANKGQDPRGRPPNRNLKIWITKIGHTVEGIGGCIMEKTSAGPRLASGFGRLLKCLCKAMRPYGVHLPAEGTIMMHARDALRGEREKSPRGAPNTRFPRPRRRS